MTTKKRLTTSEAKRNGWPPYTPQRLLGSAAGQASTEYALVTLAFVSMLTALALLWHAGRGGALLDKAVEAGSHLWEGGDLLGAMRDVVLF